MEKASRYSVVPKISSFSLGLQGSSSFSPLWGHDKALVVSEGVSSGAEGAMGRIPLCVVLIEDVSVLSGWNEPPWGLVDIVSANELALVPVGSEYASPFEKMIDCHLEEGGRDEGWSLSCLAKFSCCLGMPTKGFKAEILYLLRRMKERIDQKGQTTEMKGLLLQ